MRKIGEFNKKLLVLVTTKSGIDFTVLLADHAGSTAEVLNAFKEAGTLDIPAFTDFSSIYGHSDASAADVA